MSKIRIYIATTDGPSEVQRLEKEDPEVRSVICMRNTSESLPISPAYDAFVRKPTGTIERLYGHPVYRMDVSERITGGSSWQLGAIVAHALKAAGRLAGKDDTPDQVLWLTGEVDSDLNILPVDHVAKKLLNSSGLFAELKNSEIPITVVIPRQNSESSLKEQPNIPPILSLDSVEEVFNHLKLQNSISDKSKISQKPTLLLSSHNNNKPTFNKILAFSLIGIVGVITTLWAINNNDKNTTQEAKISQKIPNVLSRLIELRAPKDSNCAAIRFGKTKAKEVEAVPVTPNQYHSTNIGTLCGIKLYIESSAYSLDAELHTNLTEGDAYINEDLSSRLIPKRQQGKKLSWQVLFSRRLRKNFHYQWNISLEGKDMMTKQIKLTHIGSM